MQTTHPWHATLRGRTDVRDADGGATPPGHQQAEALVLQGAGYQAILHGHAGGTGRTFWPRAAGPYGTAPPGKGHSRPNPMSTGRRGPPRPTI